MILTTDSELRLYVPNNLMNQIQNLKGFIETSENDFLVEKLGDDLYDEMIIQYNNRGDITDAEATDDEWRKLIFLSQRAIVNDALYRMTDIHAVSMNASGFNAVSTDGYDVADPKLIEKAKDRYYKEAHKGIDRMLVQLEKWCEEVTDTTEDGPKKTIVTLWKTSRFYYRISSLFISTAVMLQDYLDIYDSREKFISLLPDLRYIQSILIRNEIGGDLTDRLIGKSQTGAADEKEAIAIEKIRWWMAMELEARNKMFKRDNASQDAVLNRQIARQYLIDNHEEFSPEIGKGPLYDEPEPVVETTDKPVEQSAIEKAQSGEGSVFLFGGFIN